MNKNSLIKRQQGMTLVEIMIAMGLGVFLLAGVMGIFISSKQSYRMLENLSRMQENGRFAMDFMSRDIRQAGLREQCFDQQIPSAISGTEGVDGASDSITTLISTADCPVAPNVLATIPTIYSIENGVSGQPTLKRSVSGNKQELIEGIENMQILYGEDTDIDKDYVPNYYLAAGTAGLNMDNVVSIRITLTVRTLDDNLTAAGGRLKRTFTSTIAVRNRLP